MRGARRSQLHAFLLFAAVLSAAGFVALACTNYQRSNGDACLKDVDCLTGYCKATVCASPPAALDGDSYVEAGLVVVPTEDASTATDAGTDTGSTGTDASQDAPADG